MKNLLFFSVALALCLVACNDTPDNPVNEDYLPLTKGSWWTYKTTFEDNSVKFDTLRVLAQDTIVAGKKYAVLSYLLPFQSFRSRFIRFENGEYRGLEVWSPPGEYLALRTENLQDSTWTVFNTFIGMSYTFMDAELKEKGINYQVGSTTYEQVIHCEATHYGGNPSFNALDKGYFAKGVGLIFCERIGSHITSNRVELLDYYIAP